MGLGLGLELGLGLGLELEFGLRLGLRLGLGLGLERAARHRTDAGLKIIGQTGRVVPGSRLRPPG